MQNKPNLLNAQINISSFITKDYENAHLLGREKNKPNQTQSVVSKVEPPVVSLPVPSAVEGSNLFQTFCWGFEETENVLL